MNFLPLLLFRITLICLNFSAMAGGTETRTISKSIMEQVRSPDVEELNYILKDNFEGKFH